MTEESRRDRLRRETGLDLALVSELGGGGEGGGVSDHGGLTGLSDDDHAQYLNNARGDARYAPISHIHQTSDMETDLGTMQDTLDDVYAYFSWHDDRLEFLESHVVSMGSSGTLSVDASLGNHFRADLTGDATLSNPTNLTKDGQKFLFEFTQDGTGGHTLTTDTMYVFSPDLFTSMELSTGPGKTDLFAGVLRLSVGKIYIFGRARGY